MDKQNHPSDSGKGSQSPHREALHESAGFDRVGDKSGNHAWNQMKGIGEHQRDKPLSPYDKDSLHMGGHGRLYSGENKRSDKSDRSDKNQRNDGPNDRPPSDQDKNDKNHKDHPPSDRDKNQKDRHGQPSDQDKNDKHPKDHALSDKDRNQKDRHEHQPSDQDKNDKGRSDHPPLSNSEKSRDDKPTPNGDDKSNVTGSDDGTGLTAQAGRNNTAVHAAGGPLTEGDRSDQTALNAGLSPNSTAALYGNELRNSDGANLARPYDGGTDKLTEGQGLKSPPELPMITPEALLNAPVPELKQIANGARKSLEDYVANNRQSLPTFNLHGTTRDGAKFLQQKEPGQRDLFTAGQDPDRRALGDVQYLKDMSRAFTVANSYTGKWATKDDPAGPMMIYHVGNDDKGWSKLPGGDGRHGESTEGQSFDDFTKYAVLDSSKAKLIGKIPRAQLDGMNEKFQPHEDAVQAKYHQINDPSGVGSDKAKDLMDRLNVMRQLKRTHELGMTLDAVARSQSNLM